MTQKGTEGQTGKEKPLRLEDVQRILAGHKAELKAQGVKSLAVFGSVARGESEPDSDLDLLVEFDRAIGLFHFIHVKDRLKDILGGVEIDLVIRDAVYDELKDDIYTEAVDVV